MSHKNTIKDSIKLIPLLAVSLFLLLASFGTSLALGGNVSGFAWGAVDENADGNYDPNEGGIGWLSFSHLVDFPSSSNNFYQVSLDSTTGDLSGQAWTNHIGYVSFDAGCPSGVTGTCSAKVTNFQNGNVEGWARACKVFQTGCSGVTKPINGTELGGWDGWIEMSGINHESGFFDITGNPIPATIRGVTLDVITGDFSGFAWGGNATDGHNDIGWISFGEGLSTGGGTTTGCPNVSSACPPPTITFLAAPSTITPGQTVNLTWQTSNVVNGCTVLTEVFDETSALVSTSNTAWSDYTPTQPDLTNTNGTHDVLQSGVSAGYIIHYRLTCTSVLTTLFVDQYVGVVADEEVPGNTVMIYANGANPITTISIGNPVTLTWSAISGNGTPLTTVLYTSCTVTADGPVTGTGWSNNQFVINDPNTALLDVNSPQHTSVVTLSGTGTVIFTINCEYGTTIAADSVTVNQTYLPVTVVFTQATTVILAPTSNATGSVYLDWDVSSNATSCDFSWDPNNHSPLDAFSTEVVAAGGETFTVTCYGPGNQSATDSLYVEPGGPQCTPGVNCPTDPPPPVFEEF